ncbi:MAG TPA: hypothetical protein VLR26_03645 [Frankiaceae bacterium]|nr:hypothetical protein [Frankiaceae bacterium]
MVVSQLYETVTTARVDWSNDVGMFLANGNLYFVTRSDGVLRQVPVSAGATKGPPVGVAAGTGWAARDLFTYAP